MIWKVNKPFHKKRATKLRAEGKTYAQIGEILGVSAQMAYYYSSLKRQKNIRKTDLNSGVRELDIDQILKELDDGKFD